MTPASQASIELRSADEFNLATTDGCIEQIVYGFNVVNAGYGIADSALLAYLKIEGNTASTLIVDLKQAGCPIADSTVRNRCSQLVKKGLLPKTSNAGRPAKAKVEESTEAITEAVITEAVIDVEPIVPSDTQPRRYGLGAYEERVEAKQAVSRTEMQEQMELKLYVDMWKEKPTSIEDMTSSVRHDALRQRAHIRHVASRIEEMNELEQETVKGYVLELAMELHDLLDLIKTTQPKSQ